jgi:hypothetical protein
MRKQLKPSKVPWKRRPVVSTKIVCGTWTRGVLKINFVRYFSMLVVLLIMSNRKTLNFEEVVVKNKTSLCGMIYEFLTFLWDYALKKPEYFLISYQDGPPDQSFFDAFSTAFRLSKSYH